MKWTFAKFDDLYETIALIGNTDGGVHGGEQWRYVRFLFLYRYFLKNLLFDSFIMNKQFFLSISLVFDR
jgi:hypothetical protein